MIHRIVRAAGLCLAVFLAACGTTSSPAPAGSYKVGAPYQVGGQWYYPKVDPEYDETGIASWYGAEFAGSKTANGEIFDPKLITAAHRTLPMPSNVRITNLANGKSIVARVNDRGPFKASRILDLSEAGAILLGFKNDGMARVRVEFVEIAQLPQGRPGERVAGVGKQANLGKAKVPPLPPAPVVTLPAEPGGPPVPVASPLDQPNGDVIKVPVNNKGRIYVQVGSFLDRGNAEALVARLRPVAEFRIAALVKDEKTFYRVRAGPMGSVRQADNLLDQVVREGQNGAQIVVE